MGPAETKARLGHSGIVATIGERLRAARRAAGLSRKQFAVRADVSERYLNDLENGGANVSIGVLSRLTDALALNLADIVIDAATRQVGHRQPAKDALGVLVDRMSAQERSGAVALVTRYLDERRRRQRGIALLGLRGAGKTTIGTAFAERHGVPFFGVTREIEVRAGMGLAELFNLGGANAYRALENEVLRDVTNRPGPIVLETAGGIVGNSEALDLIFDAYTTVWLKASPEEHLSRVAGQGDMRPMHGNPRALEHLQRLLAEREPEYARAEHRLDTSGRSIEDCVGDLQRIAKTVFAK